MKKLVTLTFFVFTVFVFFYCGNSNIEEDNRITRANKHLEDGDYQAAMYILNSILSSDPSYDSSLVLFEKARQIEAFNDSVREEVNTMLNSMPNWHKKYFKDSFGDTTNESYVITYGEECSFTNSATMNNKDLQVQLLINDSNIGLFLHEYTNNPAVKASEYNKFKMQIRDHNKNEITLYSSSQWNNEGGALFGKNSKRKLINFLKKATKENEKENVRVLVSVDDRSTYRFNLNMQGFNDNIE